MEDNDNYKSIQAIIKNLEQQLKSIEEVQSKQDFSMMRREIEGHFERAIHALGARQQILIDQLNYISHFQDSVFQDTTAQLKEKINKCTEMKQAGVFTYKHSIPSAELVWQEALKLKDKPVDASALLLRVTVDLPTELLANIDTHGNVGPSTKPHQEPPKTNLPKVEPEKKESPISEAKAVEKAKSNVIVGSTNGSAAPNFQAPLTVEASSQVASKFVVLLEDDKEEHMFEYKAESQLTREKFLEIIRQSFPYLGNKGFVFCVGGIALDTDRDLADHVKRRTTLSLVKESLLIEVEIKLHLKPYQWHSLRSVTLQRLSESIPLPSSYTHFFRKEL